MNFSYKHKSKTIFYKGYVFDSTIELKYALSIEDTYAWLRNGIEIYYGINVQPSGIKTNLHCYRPDFLVRNLSNHQAELIEIKPDGFNIAMQPMRIKIVAKFIERFAYDWTYRIITESEILLSSQQSLHFKEILASQEDWHHQPGSCLFQNNTPLTDSQYEQFVRTGWLPTVVL